MNCEITKSSTIKRFAFSPVEKRIASEIFNELKETKKTSLTCNNLLRFHTKMKRHIKCIEDLKVKIRSAPIKTSAEPPKLTESNKSPSKRYRIKSFQKRSSIAKFVISDSSKEISDINSPLSCSVRRINNNQNDFDELVKRREDLNSSNYNDVNFLKKIVQYVDQNSSLISPRRAWYQDFELVEENSDGGKITRKDKRKTRVKMLNPISSSVIDCNSILNQNTKDSISSLSLEKTKSTILKKIIEFQISEDQRQNFPKDIPINKCKRKERLVHMRLLRSNPV